MVGMRVSTMQMNEAFTRLSASSGLGKSLQTEIQRRQAEVKEKNSAKTEESTSSPEKKQACECSQKSVDIKTEIKNAVAQKDYEKAAQLAGIKSPYNAFSYKGLSLFKVNA
ncbi:hypothetical protein OOP60_002984 [Salmonella enterica]|nr:hypothetical protein [Salmonella enterica]EEU3909618.1 hypothetical protein [Salmonella enterica]EGY4580829.1 hypothetical protein [Salmonella enterica]EGY4585997.1 hypothetical protein [Salmonella enterica]EGY9843152.1 hypothetical protein [Salmonella enterica]